MSKNRAKSAKKSIMPLEQLQTLKTSIGVLKLNASDNEKKKLAQIETHVAALEKISQREKKRKLTTTEIKKMTSHLSALSELISAVERDQKGDKVGFEALNVAKTTITALDDTVRPPATFAFLDLDDTVIDSSANKLNVSLLMALKSSGITDVCFFTSMNNSQILHDLNGNSKFTREEIIKVLENEPYNFTVHKVITTCDIFEQGENRYPGSYYENKWKPTYNKISGLINAEKMSNSDIQKHEDYISLDALRREAEEKQNEKFQKILHLEKEASDLEKKGDLSGSNKKKQEAAAIQNSIVKDSKADMYRLALELRDTIPVNGKKIGSVVFVDDRINELAHVAHENNENQLGIKLSCINAFAADGKRVSMGYQSDVDIEDKDSQITAQKRYEDSLNRHQQQVNNPASPKSSIYVSDQMLEAADELQKANPNNKNPLRTDKTSEKIIVSIKPENGVKQLNKIIKDHETAKKPNIVDTLSKIDFLFRSIYKTYPDNDDVRGNNTKLKMQKYFVEFMKKQIATLKDSDALLIFYDAYNKMNNLPVKISDEINDLLSKRADELDKDPSKTIKPTSATSTDINSTQQPQNEMLSLIAHHLVNRLSELENKSHIQKIVKENRLQQFIESTERLIEKATSDQFNLRFDPIADRLLNALEKLKSINTSQLGREAAQPTSTTMLIGAKLTHTHDAPPPKIGVETTKPIVNNSTDAPSTLDSNHSINHLNRQLQKAHGAFIAKIQQGMQLYGKGPKSKKLSLLESALKQERKEFAEALAGKPANEQVKMLNVEIKKQNDRLGKLSKAYEKVEQNQVQEERASSPTRPKR